ncbi:membrane-associated guanylate kinase, WW and PDZ domain-containing protein 1-like [Hemiscyllium ocellatum]|uniref:membrane-associated guanylate kinase, WW and PDZ domain-containing protein 1-like n=1 Tax=Hemiscyllium ocellatum TaxID=170820 RepID=UPI002966A6F3|nr:membrane-associated guanylate kinase, WW and PDZ domain-containing protein 1-like [Hemiscyllium ocellatum]
MAVLPPSGPSGTKDTAAHTRSGATERGRGDPDSGQGSSASAAQDTAAAPRGSGRAGSESSEPWYDVPTRHGEELTLLPSPMETGDEASLGSSVRADSQEADRKARSVSKPRDIPGLSSRLNPCDSQTDWLLPGSDPHGHESRGSHSDQEEAKGAEFYTVDLKRSPTGFGFSVRGGREYDMDLYILGMIVGGPAMRSGKIKIGDQLVEINGEPTIGMSHAQAVELIRHGQDRIHLRMRSGNGQVPEFGPDMEAETDLGDAAVVLDRQAHPLPGPRGERGLRSARGQARRESVAPSSPEHPRTRQRRLCRGLSKATDAWPVAGGTRGHRRNHRRRQRADDAGPETNLKPQSQAPSTQQSGLRPRAHDIPDPCQPQAVPDRTAPRGFGVSKAQTSSVYSRPQALLDPRPQALRDSRPDTQVESRVQTLPSHSRPQALLDSRPDTQVKSRVQTLPSHSRPQALLDSRPDTQVKSRVQTLPSHSRPQAAVDSRPQAAVDSRPQAAVDSRPQAAVDSRPQAAVDSRPQAAVDSRPQAAVDSRPQAALDSRPQAALDSRPQAALDSRPNAQVEFRARPPPSHAGPQAIPNDRPLSEESTETDSDGWETDWEGASRSSAEAPAFGSFDEQRQFSSMIGKGLDLTRVPPVSSSTGKDTGAHCGSRMASTDRQPGKVRGVLSPGPWLLPKGEKHLGILWR